MSANTAKEPIISPELRATAFYFSIYMAGAAFNVYGGIWFADKGLTSEQIGIINAVPVLVTLLFNMIVGRIVTVVMCMVGDVVRRNGSNCGRDRAHRIS